MGDICLTSEVDDAGKKQCFRRPRIPQTHGHTRSPEEGKRPRSERDASSGALFGGEAIMGHLRRFMI